MTDQNCPTCGSPVTVQSSGEGTSYYVPAGRDRSPALQAAHESLADYPAIVAMHEEQTEKAEAEVQRVNRELHQVHLNYHHMVDVAQGLREALREISDKAADDDVTSKRALGEIASLALDDKEEK